MYKVEVNKTDIVVLKEWESGERDILLKFHKFLKGELKKGILTLVGFNVLKFDIPCLIYRFHYHKLNPLNKIFEIFRKAYVRDLRQCLLPFNKYSFKGLSAERIAEIFRITKPCYSGSQIKGFYDRKKYGKIVEHAISDIKFLSDLSWSIRDPKMIFERFTKTHRGS